MQPPFKGFREEGRLQPCQVPSPVPPPTATPIGVLGIFPESVRGCTCKQVWPYTEGGIPDTLVLGTWPEHTAQARRICHSSPWECCCFSQTRCPVGVSRWTQAPSGLCCCKPHSDQVQQDAQASMECSAGPLMATRVCLTQLAPHPHILPGLAYRAPWPLLSSGPLCASALSFWGTTQGSCEMPPPVRTPAPDTCAPQGSTSSCGINVITGNIFISASIHPLIVST